MAEISDLEQRINQALDRIGVGLDAVAGASSGNIEALQDALDAEKMANAQLEERLRTLNEKHEAEMRELRSSLEDRVSQLEGALEALTEESSGTKAQARALRQSNQRLQASLQTLREESATGIEPHLINHAMMSELEALRASRLSDQAELTAILGTLKPMLEETQDA